MGTFNRSPACLSAFIVIVCILLHSGGSHAFETIPLRQLFTITHNFLQPSDVAVGEDFRIYVLDGVNNRVKIFDEDGVFLSSFGGAGTAKGRFNAPLGITTDRQGRVYVADSRNRRVQLFSPNGAFIDSFPVTAGKKELPSDPVDLVVDDKRKRLYVVDNDNHHILVYSLKNFKQKDTWGSLGDGMQMFNHPFLIALGKDTSVIVVDVLNTRVQIWSPKGEALTSIGEWGVDLGQLYRPKGACVDRDNNIFVSDSYLGVIQVFNRYGYFKAVAADEDGKVIKWQTPVGITIDGRQRLYVVEMLANQVQVYQIITD